MFEQILPPQLVAALTARGITEASPIQQESLPHTLEGRDLLGRARTGTGKTLAFVLPIALRLEASSERSRSPRALILAPTRELARQIGEEVEKSAPHLKSLLVYGGASYGPQESALRRGVDVLVGTPGRIIDHLERGNLDLSNVEVLVLDEADEMLSVGFAEAIERVLQTVPPERQTMLLSATLTDAITRLSRKYLKDPITIDLVGNDRMKASTSVEHLKVAVGRTRTRVLADLLTVYAPEKAIVFTRTKREADELALELIHRGIEAEGLHGDLAQSQRERALGRFRGGSVTVLVATDVAARGLDIPEVDLVVQYHLPQDPESYVHRSGRTGRAGRTGTAIVMYGDRERRDLRFLEHATGVHFKERSIPSPKEVRDASAQAAADVVRGIAEDYALPFMDQAEQLLSEMGTQALARALAKVAGATKPERSVSLLSGEEGVVSVELVAPRLSVGRAVAVIAAGSNIDTRRLGKVRLSERGAVVDVPEELAGALLALQEIEGVQVRAVTELPRLLEDPKESRPKGRRRDFGDRFDREPGRGRRRPRGRRD